MKTWTSESYKKNILPHKGNGKILTLTPHALLRSMSDSELKKEFPNTPIPAVDFIATLDSMLDTLNKSVCWHIFHVDIIDRVVAVFVRWGDDEWRLSSSGLDYVGPWRAGRVFWTLATDTKTLENTTLIPSDTLSFDQALKIVKDAGCTVTRTKTVTEEL